MSEIAQQNQCSRITAKRATDKFHKDGVIIKQQLINCFDINQFTIDNIAIFNLDKSDSKKMSHINININKYYIYTYSNSNNILNNSSINTARVSARVCGYTKKGNVMEVNKDLFTKHNIQLTGHGEIYFKYVPESAIQHALNKLNNVNGIKDVGRLLTYHIREFMKANKLVIDYGSYFRALEGAGIDKKSEMLLYLGVNKTVSGLPAAKKLEILKDVAIDPDKDIKEKLARTQETIRIGKDRIIKFEALREHRKLNDGEQSELNSEYAHLRRRNELEIKLKMQLDENQILRNDNSATDICQAERDYRVLYLKMDRDSTELNKWKWMIENADQEFTDNIRAQTIEMANVKIKQLTNSLAKDIDSLNDLDEKRKIPLISESNNFFQEGMFGTEVH
jgi:hypothetical protein